MPAQPPGEGREPRSPQTLQIYIPNDPKPNTGDPQCRRYRFPLGIVSGDTPDER
jgi:hypothetical protein